jgi:hypothetical protein
VADFHGHVKIIQHTASRNGQKLLEAQERLRAIRYERSGLSGRNPHPFDESGQAVTQGGWCLENAREHLDFAFLFAGAGENLEVSLLTFPRSPCISPIKSQRQYRRRIAEAQGQLRLMSDCRFTI